MIGTPGVPGGMHPGDPGAAVYVFFSVPDLDAAVAKVEELGGKTKPLDTDSDTDPDTAKEFGRFALCEDNQGSSFGLHEPPS